MLNVCFNGSQCGMLKYALKEKTTYSYTDLELGKIAPADFDEARRQWIDNEYAICSQKERIEVWEEQQERFQLIIDAAKRGEELRIWVSSAPFAKCGYYHLIYSLQGIDSKVFIVEMPTNIGIRQDCYDRSWGEVHPAEMKQNLGLQRELTLDERSEVAQKWQKLIEENGELRLNINGELTTVSIDYLDNEILSYAPKGKFKVVALMGEVLKNCKCALNVEFIPTRISALVEKGKLKLIKQVKHQVCRYHQSILEKAD